MMKKIRFSLTVFLGCSIFLHFAFWGGLTTLYSPQLIRQHTAPIEVTIVQPEKKSDHHNLLKDKNTQHIVEQDKNPINDERPDQAKFLSLHSQKVLRETRAAQYGKFSNVTQKSSARSHNKKLSPPSPDLASLKPDLNFSHSKIDLPPPKNHQNEGKNQNYENNTEEEHTLQAQQSQTDDYLKEVPIGMQTLLSTKEFVYYSYYNRIKEKIRQHWEPSVRENVKMAIRRGRSLASARDRVTKVLITLDGKGSLLQVQVLDRSGILELDDAAVDAFKAAAPFPNPPKGMVEQDGNIRIRWDFILEASSNDTLKNKTHQVALA